MYRHECLPIDQVIRKLEEVETDVAAFYERACGLTVDPEAVAVFTELLTDTRGGRELTEKLRLRLKAGELALQDASTEDLEFLSALAEGAFYSRTGRPADLADPALQAEHLLENAVKLEKDLLLFYMKLYGLSCAEHRPLFSELIQRCQKHVSALQHTRRRLG